VIEEREGGGDKASKDKKGSKGGSKQHQTGRGMKETTKGAKKGTDEGRDEEGYKKKKVRNQ
jgi:hypothetical protein